MKDNAASLSLVGAALALAGGLAHLLSQDPGWLPAANLVVGLLLVIVAGAVAPELLHQYGRWINALWGGIMVLAIGVLINFLADRYPQRLDVTAGKLHSLSDLTVQSLERLEIEVTALAFMENGEGEELERMLKQFATHTPSFTYEIIDPDRDPQRTREHEVRTYNTLVLVSGDRRQKVSEHTEKELTNALLKLVRDRRELVYMTVGHGEKGPGDGEDQFGRLRERLAEIDYGVEDSLLLARAGDVPDDCRVLLVGGPRSPYLEPEIDALSRYLERGGAAILMLDPSYQSGLGHLLQQWGIVLGDDFVIDTSGIGSLFGLDFTIPVATEYDGGHPVTQKHRQGLMTVFELARSVHYDDGAATGGDLHGAELVRTSQQSWAETDLSVLSRQQARRTVRLDEGVDQPGPVPLAVAVHRDGGGRLVVFGDSDFATNRYFDMQGNGDLILNALSWLAEDEELISIRPRQAGFSPVALTARQSEWIFWLSVVLYPLAIALIGVAIVSRKGRWSVADLAAAGLGIVASLGIIILVNFIGERYHSRIDLTEEGLFTLAPETVDLLSQYEDENRYAAVKTFMADSEGLRFQQTMDVYRSESRNFDYEVVDPQKRTLEVKQYDIRARGSSVVEVVADGKLHLERFEEQTEEALSNALQRALQAEERGIAFVGGHGEGQLTQVDGEGFSIFNGRLKEMNLQIHEGIELGGEMPPDAGLLAVLSPVKGYTEDEVAALRAHLERGGDALFLLDPGYPTGLEDLLEEYGIDLGDDFVVDLSGLGQLLGADVAVPVVIRYAEHPITEAMSQGTMSFFPFARSVSSAKKGTHAGLEAVELALTDHNAWGETNLAPLTGGEGAVEFDPKVDRRGPLCVAMAATADPDSSAVPGDKTRIVVFGDADFARNQHFGQQANGGLLISSVRWLTEGDDKLTIPARTPRFSTIQLAGNAGSVVLWLSVFVLPFAVALSGLVIVLRRGSGTYAAAFTSWLIYTHTAAAAFNLVLAVIGLSEGNLVKGEGYLVLGLAMAAAAYGLSRRDRRAWAASLPLALASAGVGYSVIPHPVLQLVYAGLFVANTCILVWIRSEFASPRLSQAPRAE